LSVWNRSKGRLLVVEDDPAGRELLVELLGEEGYAVECAADAEEAWQRLTGTGAPIETILLDWVLPGRTGLDLLKQVKADERFDMIPVVFQTARAEREAMVAGIAAGAFYFVPKPLDPEMLLSIVGAAVDDHERYQSLQETLRRGVDAIATLDQGRFRLRTLPQATALATLLSQACPDPERRVIGLGELLVNAVEHGNLGITYAEKSAFRAGAEWYGEVERRLDLPENRDKFVEVEFDRRPEEIAITIADQGPGFRWEKYLTISPERVFESHGRGIAMANLMSFSRLEYHAPGNRVTAHIAL
jgi:DNA-binding response OmpR family regulator